MSKKVRVVKVRSWRDLPEVLKPGVYIVDGVRIKVYEEEDRDFIRMAVRGIKELHREYYTS